MREGWEHPKVLAGFLYVLTAFVMFGVVTSNQPGKLADFVSYYAAGKTVLGQPGELYSLAVQKREQHAVTAGAAFLPWAHLPTEALLIAPLTFLPFSAAFNVWAAINLVILGWIVYLLRDYGGGYATGAFAVWPVLIGLGAGQDHILTLLVFVLAFLRLKEGRDFSAGCVLGLGLMRYQLTLPLLLFLAVGRRWRVLAGVATVGAAIFTLSVALVGWNFLPKYVALAMYLGQTFDQVGVPGMPTVRGFLGTVLPAGTYRSVLMVAVTVALLGWGLTLWKRGRGSFELLFALALMMAVITDPHAFSYGLTTLVLPLVLVQEQRPQFQWAVWVLAAATLLIATQRHGFLTYLLFPLLAGMVLWVARELQKEPLRVAEGERRSSCQNA